MTRTRRLIVALALAIAILIAGAVGVTQLRGGDDITTEADAVVVAPGQVASVVGPPAATLDGLVEQLQVRLESVPEDHVAWSTLGIAYVQQARVVADPSLYSRAQGALDQSLVVEPDDNFLAYAGLSALASARHDFAEGKTFAKQGLEINEFSPILWGALSDAELQLGNYEAADVAVARMLDLSPDTSSYSRASYLAELNGDVMLATTLMEQALEQAGTPTDRAFALTILGDLRFNAGDAGGALALYNQARTEEPEDAAALFGKARAEAALGQAETAVDHFSELVQMSPEPSYLIEYGEFLESLGRTAEAAEQYAVVEVVQTLFVENGVESDAAPVLFFADHGDPDRALSEAAVAIERRPFLAMYDAYAWALHVNGRDAEALVASEQALQLGTPNALFLFHSGQIKISLGDLEGGRRDLEQAVAINPFFDPLDAPIAIAMLADLDGAG
jgi:tetratricopeptide (TPR) repeat protein